MRSQSWGGPGQYDRHKRQTQTMTTAWFGQNTHTRSLAWPAYAHTRGAAWAVRLVCPIHATVPPYQIAPTHAALCPASLPAEGKPLRPPTSSGSWRRPRRGRPGRRTTRTRRDKRRGRRGPPPRRKGRPRGRGRREQRRRGAGSWHGWRGTLQRRHRRRRALEGTRTACGRGWRRWRGSGRG